MSILKVSVGLDYHQDQIQICVLDEHGKQLMNRSVANNAKLVHATVQPLGEVVDVAVEACCGAANLADELNALGWNVCLAHPGFVSRMKQNPDKTDFSDARLLADLVRVGYLPKVWLAPEALRRLRRLVRYRQQVADQRRNLKLRIRALLRENRIRAPKNCNAWTKRWMNWLESECPLKEEDAWMMSRYLDSLQQVASEISQAERKLRLRTSDDAVVSKLLDFHGVGLITAVTMRAEIGRFDRFQAGKQLSRFCGVTPRNASSGNRQADAGLIRAGNAQLRRVLIELSHRLINSAEPRWSKLAYQLLRKGKKKNVVVAAIANRWVRWLHHQMLPLKLAS